MNSKRHATAVLAAIALAGLASAHEVTTHAAMTERAVDASANAKSFLERTRLAEKNYGVRADAIRAEFQQMQRDFPGELRWKRATPRGLVIAGSVLEDAGDLPLGHFYAPHLTNLGGGGLNISAEWPNTGPAAMALCDYYGLCDSALVRAIDPGYEYSAARALDYYWQSFTASAQADRETAQILMFRSLGHVVHLLQDMTQPSHTRNDAHARDHLNFGLYQLGLSVDGRLGGGHSALERWGRHNLNQLGSWRIGSQGLFAPDYKATVAEYIDSLARFSSENWFSDDTAMRNDFIGDLAWVGIPGAGTVLPPGTAVINGVEHVIGYAPPGVPGGQILAIANQGAVDATGHWSSDRHDYTLESADDSVVRWNAEILVNKGIAQSTALIDHFFRGRLKVECDPLLIPGSDLRITNESTIGGVGLSIIPAEWKFFYTSVNKTLNEIPSHHLLMSIGSLAPGATVEVGNGVSAYLGARSSPSLPDNQRVDRWSDVIVAVRGTIGTELGCAVGVCRPRRTYHGYYNEYVSGSQYVHNSGVTVVFAVPGTDDDLEVVRGLVTVQGLQELAYDNPGSNCYGPWAYTTIALAFSGSFTIAGNTIPFGPTATWRGCLYGYGDSGEISLAVAAPISSGIGVDWNVQWSTSANCCNCSAIEVCQYMQVMLQAWVQCFAYGTVVSE